MIRQSHMYVCSSQHEMVRRCAPRSDFRWASSGEHSVRARGVIPRPGLGHRRRTMRYRCLADASEQLWQRIDAFVPAWMNAQAVAGFGPEGFRRRVLTLYNEICYARVVA